jgi:multidrug efflux pump subunit AcrA (membrane-fusion protein)
MGVAQQVDPATRTARVRIRLPDKERRFHPGMLLAATISVDAGKKLAVPQEAVMDSGKRTVVYVIKDGDTFEPREVRIGIRARTAAWRAEPGSSEVPDPVKPAGGYYEVLDGLAEGESIVVSGNFLVDSESRLKGALRD